MEINFEPPAGAVGIAIAKLLGHDPDAKVRDNLRRLKNLLEAGEIPRLRCSPRGGGRRQLEGLFRDGNQREDCGVQSAERRGEAFASGR